jgi:transcription initiation factor TFIID subunit TAF12
MCPRDVRHTWRQSPQQQQKQQKQHCQQLRSNSWSLLAAISSTQPRPVIVGCNSAGRQRYWV